MLFRPAPCETYLITAHVQKSIRERVQRRKRENGRRLGPVRALPDPGTTSSVGSFSARCVSCVDGGPATAQHPPGRIRRPEAEEQRAEVDDVRQDGRERGEGERGAVEGVVVTRGHDRKKPDAITEDDRGFAVSPPDALGYGAVCLTFLLMPPQPHPSAAPLPRASARRSRRRCSDSAPSAPGR